MTDGASGSGRRAGPARVAVAAALVAVTVVVIVVVVAARMGDGGGSDGLGRGSEPAATPDTATPSGRQPVPGYGFGEVALVVVGPDGERRVLCVMAASTAAQRARGLMEVTDPELGGYDGMVFLYPGDHTGAFWMRNTPMPLSIAYLAADGTVVSSADMAPCPDRPTCRSYPPDGAYRSALEVPQGRLADLGVVAGAVVERAGACPAA